MALALPQSENKLDFIVHNNTFSALLCGEHRNVLTRSEDTFITGVKYVTGYMTPLSNTQRTPH